MLRAEHLSLGYPGRTLLEGLTLEFCAGQVWAVLGRNGSGKSTLLHALAALRLPQAGVALLDGAPLDSMPRRRLARRVGVLLQEETHEFWGSVRDFVLLGRYPHVLSPFGWHMDDEAVARSEIESLHLAGLADRAFATLSGGERQRARAAALFAQQPLVYLLDEPLQHLDLPHQVAVLERLAREACEHGAVVIMVVHDLLFASRYCDRFLLLYGDGRFAHGGAHEVLDAGHLGELYGFPLDVVEAGRDRLFLPRRP
jgi:iron complex transport system ATP-binding protein